MTPPEMDALGDVVFDAMVRYMRREAAQLRRNARR